uniref:Rho-GAP domain-containing protein n=1 Tax=Amorphochlora amoebiformis TaxID=1561963 RepID=A0A7S0DLU9_9EUKA
MSDVNKMLPKNLAVCWAPTLMRSENPNDPSAMADIPKTISSTEALIEHCEKIFGMADFLEPEIYGSDIAPAQTVTDEARIIASPKFNDSAAAITEEPLKITTSMEQLPKAGSSMGTLDSAVIESLEAQVETTEPLPQARHASISKGSVHSDDVVAPREEPSTPADVAPEDRKLVLNSEVSDKSSQPTPPRDADPSPSDGITPNKLVRNGSKRFNFPLPGAPVTKASIDKARMGQAALRGDLVSALRRRQTQGSRSSLHSESGSSIVSPNNRRRLPPPPPPRGKKKSSDTSTSNPAMKVSAPDKNDTKE